MQDAAGPSQVVLRVKDKSYAKEHTDGFVPSKEKKRRIILTDAETVFCHLQIPLMTKA